MKILRTITLKLFILIFIHDISAQSTLPKILSESEDGFVDMVFAVIKQDTESSVPFTFDISSNADQKEVAFRVTLGNDWKQGNLNGKITTFKGEVIISRIDSRSDQFVIFMDRSYDTKINPKFMKDRINFIGISLDGDPRDPRSRPVKIKLFYEGMKEAEYAEAYLNINLSEAKVWLNEMELQQKNGHTVKIMQPV